MSQGESTRFDPAAVARLISAQAPRHRTATEFVEALDGLIGDFEDPVEELHLVQNAEGAAFLGGAIVGHQQDQGVVQFSQLAKVFDQATNLGVGVFEEDLARSFGLSRMPVREALRQLEAQALIDFVPHKGAVVTDISLGDALDTYVIRRALETAALALSVPQLTADDLAQARDLIDDMDREPEPQRMGELNRRFHMTLYARAGRPKLLALIEAQLISYDRYLRYHLSAHGREHMAQADHRAMIEAAEAGDAETAVAILTRHIDTAAETIRRFFEARRG